MFDLDPVDESFLDSAQYRLVHTMELASSADEVWSGLTASQPLDWCRMFTRVGYTSDPPYGTGATRASQVAWGAMEFREHFFRWDDADRRHSFYVTQCNLPLTRAFAEDYHVVQTDEGCRFTWTFAFDENARYRTVLRAGMPGIRLLLRSFARDTERQFGKSKPSHMWR